MCFYFQLELGKNKKISHVLPCIFLVIQPASCRNMSFSPQLETLSNDTWVCVLIFPTCNIGICCILNLPSLYMYKWCMDPHPYFCTQGNFKPAGCGKSYQGLIPSFPIYRIHFSSVFLNPTFTRVAWCLSSLFLCSFTCHVLTTKIIVIAKRFSE